MRANSRIPGQAKPSTTTTNRAVVAAGGGGIASSSQLTLAPPLASGIVADGASSCRRLPSALHALSSASEAHVPETGAGLGAHAPRPARPLGSAAIRISRLQQAVVVVAARAASAATAAAAEAGAGETAAAPGTGRTRAITSSTAGRGSGRRGGGALSIGSPQVKPALKTADPEMKEAAARREARSRQRRIKKAPVHSLLTIPLVTKESDEAEVGEEGGEGEEKTDAVGKYEAVASGDVDADLDSGGGNDDKTTAAAAAAPKRKGKTTIGRAPASSANIAKVAAAKAPAWLKEVPSSEIHRQRADLEADRREKLAARLRDAQARGVPLSAVSSRNARARAQRSTHDPLAKKAFEVAQERERAERERRKMFTIEEDDDDNTATTTKKKKEERYNYAHFADPTGRPQWWGLEVPDSDGRRASLVARWLEAAPRRIGPGYSGGPVEAWVPKKTVKAWSFASNKMGTRVVAFRSGATVFFRARMTLELGEYISSSIIDQSARYNERELLTGRISGYTKSVMLPGVSEKHQIPVPLGDASGGFDGSGGFDEGELIREAREWVERAEVWDRARTWEEENPGRQGGIPLPTLGEELEEKFKREDASSSSSERGRKKDAEGAGDKDALVQALLKKVSGGALDGLDIIASTAVATAEAKAMFARQAARRAAAAAAATAAAAAATAEARGVIAAEEEEARVLAGLGRLTEGDGDEEYEDYEEGGQGFSRRVAEASRLSEAAARAATAAAGWNVGAPPPSFSDRYSGGGRGGGFGGGGRGGGRGGRGGGGGGDRGGGFREREYREYAPRGGARGGRAGGGGGGGWASNSFSSRGGGGGGNDYDSFDSFAGGGAGSGGFGDDDGFGVGGAWGDAGGGAASVDYRGGGGGNGGGAQQRRSERFDAGAAAARDFYESDAAASLGGGGDSWESSTGKGSFESAFESLGLGDDDDDADGGGTFSAGKKKAQKKTTDGEETNAASSFSGSADSDDPASWFQDEGLEWE